jgi:hypothetical protein
MMEVSKVTIRTRIYLPEELYQRLQDRSKATGKSMAEQIRESLTIYFTEIKAGTPKPEDPIWGLIGATQSKDQDLSTRYDDYLYPKNKDTMTKIFPLPIVPVF